MKVKAGPGPRPKPKSKVKDIQKRLLYSPSKVKNALSAIESGMPLSRASKLFGVPRATLWNKTNNRAPAHATHPGPVSVLPADVERKLCDYVLHLARRGFPLDTDALADSVKKVVLALNLTTPFVDNRPSRKWLEGFLRRFPEVSVKQSEHLGTHRSLITEKSIRAWHSEVQDLLTEDGVDLSIFDDPSRIWNCDETAVFLSPKGGNILGPRGESVYNVSKNSDKDCITVLFTVNANGEMALPLALFPYERIPTQIVQNCPLSWGLGRSEKGWMTGESFFEFVANVFLPYLKDNDVLRPVILFLDGHKSHITKHLNELCNDEGIILIALLPNATAILQPLDVAVFRPLKLQWLKITKRWRIAHGGEEVNRYTFCTAVDEAVHDTDLKKAIISGFRVTGLYPYNADNIDYAKCVVKHKEPIPRVVGEIPVESHLDYLEAKIDPFILEQFRSTKDGIWTGNDEAKMLFSIWQSFVLDKGPTQTPTAPQNLCLDTGLPNILNQVSDNTDPVDNATFNQSDLRNHHTSTDISPVSLPKTPPVPALQITPNTSSSSIQHLPCGSNDNPSCLKSLKEVFEETLFWPGTPKKRTSLRKKREKIPSVLTGSAWKTLHASKEKMRQDKEREKEIREKKRLEKKVKSHTPRSAIKNLNKKDKQKLQKFPEGESSDEVDEPLPLVLDIDSEVSDARSVESSGEEDEHYEVTNDKITQGSFAVVDFKGGKRMTTVYTYVCIIQRPPEEGEDSTEVCVMALNCHDSSKKVFVPNEDDVSFVQVQQIKAILPQPKLVMNGDRVRYVFRRPIRDVFERAK